MQLFVDAQLDPTQEKCLLDAIRSNPAFTRSIMQEPVFREFIKLKIQNRRASPALIANIQRTIADRILVEQ